MNGKLKLILVAGARPNFMKVAPLVHAINRFNNSVNPSNSSNSINPSNPSNSTNPSNPSNSTNPCNPSNAAIGFDTVLSPQSSALNANGRRKPIIAHVEAGLRSFDRTMPEEINRLVTDSIADLLFTPSEDADENLLREGVPKEKIKRVGNIMIDTLISNLEGARSRNTWRELGVKHKQYAFVTLHRPSNVDARESLSGIVESLTRLCKKIPVVFPAHPRTRKRLEDFGLWSEAERLKDLKLLDPIGYLDTICFEENSRFVLTDSGGIQEETTFLGIPCLTLRPNTERPITITQGTNKLTSLGALEQDFDFVLNGHQPSARIPELWDGKTAERIIQILAGSKT